MLGLWAALTDKRRIVANGLLVAQLATGRVGTLDHGGKDCLRGLGREDGDEEPESKESVTSEVCCQL